MSESPDPCCIRPSGAPFHARGRVPGAGAGGALGGKDGADVGPTALRFLKCFETTLSTIPTGDVLARIDAADLSPIQAGSGRS